MEQLVLHAGTVKTGTTYLQKTFYENRTVLKRHGIDYPQVFPADLHLPRYANAKFLYDRSRDNEAREQIYSSPARIVIISEEGIFGTIAHAMHPAFDGLPKKVLLYVRPAAELLGAWAAEKSEPYNVARLPDYNPTGLELLPIDEQMGCLSDEYAKTIDIFMHAVDEIGPENIVVRPFERSSMVGHELLTDFFHCLGVDVTAVRADPEFRDPGVTNSSRTRKFCDLSRAIWLLLGKPTQLDTFNVHLVEAVNKVCESGDARQVIDTLTDAQIEAFTNRFEYFEKFISHTFLDGASLFQRRFPACFGAGRAPYKPLNSREVELLTELTLLRRGAGGVVFPALRSSR